MPHPPSPSPAAGDGQSDPDALRARAESVVKTILICEDEPSLRELVQAVLGPVYRYHEAVDGVEALELVRSLGPDLVVLDLMLPRLSGFEVLAGIRRDPSVSKTPVIVLTAWAHVQADAEAIGADRFIAKPFEPAELEEVVRELLVT
jgi:CheY-like chemotaxis protein